MTFPIRAVLVADAKPQIEGKVVHAYISETISIPSFPPVTLPSGWSIGVLSLW
jgi:hypothetical protein